jgi:hypothetical protein
VELGNLGMPRWQSRLRHLAKWTWETHKIHLANKPNRKISMIESKASSLLKGIILPLRKILRGELHVIKNLKAIHPNTQMKLKIQNLEVIS